MTVPCPGQMCGVCGGKGHSVEICAIVVTAFALEADATDNDGDKILSGKEKTPSSVIYQVRLQRVW